MGMIGVQDSGRTHPNDFVLKLVLIYMWMESVCAASNYVSAEVLFVILHLPTHVSWRGCVATSLIALI